MLRTRLLTALILGPVVLAAAWFREPWLSLGVTLVALVALVEVANLLRAAEVEVPRVTTVAAGLLITATVLLSVVGRGWDPVVAASERLGGLGLPAASMAAAIVLLAGAALRHPEPRVGIAAWMGSLYAVGYLGFLVPTIALVGHLAPTGRTPETAIGVLGWESGTAWLLLTLALVWSCDSGAYLVGRAIGRRKLHPLVSPGKTVEGYLGGILVAAIVTGLLGWQLIGFDIPIGLAIGAFVAAVAQWGDLAKSMLKRVADRKDSGSLFPGHGGMLDRIDSLIFATPLILALALTIGGMSLSP
jgi:phosphatidate cytidylyltransferase